MSFFGFDATLPRDRDGPPQQRSRGIFDQHDPFAGLGGPEAADDADALDFEQTYDGLGQRLQESGDTFNDDTFGGDGPVTRQTVGKDFDFAGNTAKVRDTLLEEHTLHAARQPMQQVARPPKRSGYEAYKQPEYIPRLEADASIWGTSVAKKPAEQSLPKQDFASARKMMSLEEVEAMMRTQPRPTPPMQDTERQSQGLRDMLGVGSSSPQQVRQEQPPPPVQQPQILQRPQQQEPVQPPAPAPDYSLRAPQILQRQPFPQPPGPHSQEINRQMQSQQSPQPPLGPSSRGPPQQSGHGRGPSYGGPPITQAQQMMQMSTDDRDAYLAEEARRAKRNHKIFLLSKSNGLMSPQDKNFITRIQLQQLLTATGGVDNEPGSEEQLGEDFYYQVYAQIRGPPRSGPGQPLSQFAQTYLFQTGSRYGYGRSRHHPRGGDNHVQRMEQQVARAVEAAKARPKNKSLVVEGSLGKIAFSNAKTPRPLLNIKQRPENEAKLRAAKSVTVADRKATLRDIEEVYTVLMRMEDHERKLPPPPNEESPPEVIEAHMQWRSDMAELNQRLWSALKVMEPIQAR